MSELYSICDTVTIMRNGETIADHPLPEKTEIELLSVMTGRNMDSIRRHHHGHQGAGGGEALVSVDHLPIPSYARDIPFTVAAGEVVGVAGLQGHGQSDLVRSLFGINGSIRARIGGKDETVSSPSEAVRHSFAFISGDREKEGAFSERSLAENVSAVSELAKGGRVDDFDAVLSRAHALGAAIVYGPAAEPWGVRRFYLRDPAGTLVNIVTHTEA